MGELRGEIRSWCAEVRYERASEPELKKKLKSILKRWGNTRVIRQNIGMAIQGWTTSPFDLQIKNGDIWKLVDQVEPRIRFDYKKWAEAMKK